MRRICCFNRRFKGWKSSKRKGDCLWRGFKVLDELHLAQINNNECSWWIGSLRARKFKYFGLAWAGKYEFKTIARHIRLTINTSFVLRDWKANEEDREARTRVGV